MKNEKLTFYFCVVLLTLSMEYLQAQTTSFLYQSSSLSRSACNVFSSPVSVNGYTHYYNFGGVSFDGTELNLPISSQPIYGVNSEGQIVVTNYFGTGTDYMISYPFVSGKTYTISYVCKINGNIGGYTKLESALFTNRTDYGESCQPSIAVYNQGYGWNSYNDGGFQDLLSSNSTQISGTSWTTITTTFNTGAASYNYIDVAGYSDYSFSSKSSPTGNLQIQSITITASCLPVPSPSITITGIEPLNRGTQMDVQVSTTLPPPYLWYVNGSLVYTANTTSATINGGNNCGVTNTLKVQVSNSCGTNSATTTYVRPCGTNSYSVSPNPSKGIVTVSAQSNTESNINSNGITKSTGENKIYSVRIIDNLGNIKKIINYPSGVTTTNIDLSSIINGTYTMQVYNNSAWTSEQILIIK